MGLACMIPEGLRCCLGQRMVLLRVDRQVADHRYVLFSLLSEHVQRAISILGGTGSTVGNLRIPVLKGLQIIVPKISEQMSIADALSDVDALLSGLDKLIAKKRDLKQAAMHQLLTGKTRLPGFSGEWVVRRLGDHLKFLKSGTNSRAELGEEGDVKYLHYGDIHTSRDAFLTVSGREMPHLPPAKAEGLARLQNGDLVFADASEDLTGVAKSVEICSVGDEQIVSGLHTIAVRFDKLVLVDGFKAHLQFIPSFRNHLLRLVAGTKVFSTNRAHISSCELALPSAVEQDAIAQVLNDIDADLATLVGRREKTKLLKQGMMQELLTGETRLI